MSVYTTLFITRSKALEEMLRSLKGDISNGELEAFMDKLLESRLYNVLIVPDGTEPNDDNTV